MWRVFGLSHFFFTFSPICMFVLNRKGKVWNLPAKEALQRIKAKEMTEMTEEEILEHFNKSKAEKSKSVKKRKAIQKGTVTKSEPEKGNAEMPLDQLTDEELKAKGKEAGVKGWNLMKRENLIKALS